MGFFMSKVYRTLEFDTGDMALRGRIGAYRLHATHDRRVTTAAARAAFLARFEAEVDPDGALPPEERARRAESARKAYFARLSYRSAKARKGKAKKGNGNTTTVVPGNGRAGG